MTSVMVMVGDISELIEGASASVMFFYMLVIIGLIIMRCTHREEPRLFKVTIILLSVILLSFTHSLPLSFFTFRCLPSLPFHLFHTTL